MCVPAKCKVAASVQKSGQNIDFKKSYLKKCVSKIADFGPFCPISRRFGLKTRKVCQLWRSISRQPSKLFEFCKKFLPLYIPYFNISNQEDNLKFWVSPPYRLNYWKLWFCSLGLQLVSYKYKYLYSYKYENVYWPNILRYADLPLGVLFHKKLFWAKIRKVNKMNWTPKGLGFLISYKGPVKIYRVPRPGFGDLGPVKNYSPPFFS